jgi:hypothetical protein
VKAQNELLDTHFQTSLSTKSCMLTWFVEILHTVQSYSRYLIALRPSKNSFSHNRIRSKKSYMYNDMCETSKASADVRIFGHRLKLAQAGESRRPDTYYVAVVLLIFMYQCYAC